MHTLTRTHTRTQTHIHTLTHTHSHIYVCPHSHTYSLTPKHAHSHTLWHTHTFTHLHATTHSHIYSHTNAHPYTHALTHIHTHSHAHTLTYTLTHTHTHSQVLTHIHTHMHTFTQIQKSGKNISIEFVQHFLEKKWISLIINLMEENVEFFSACDIHFRCCRCWTPQLMWYLLFGAVICLWLCSANFWLQLDIKNWRYRLTKIFLKIPSWRRYDGTPCNQKFDYVH